MDGVGEIWLCQHSHWNNCPVWRSSTVQVLVWFGLEEVLTPECPFLHPHMQELLLHRAPWNSLLEVVLHVWSKKKKIAPPCFFQNFASINFSRTKFSMFSCSNLVKVLMLVQKESNDDRNCCIWEVKESLMSFHILEGMGFHPGSGTAPVFNDMYAADLMYCYLSIV